MSPPILDVHLVSHTHWDREWYQPLGRFRQRLVALVDELLDDPPPPGSSFLLDGQAIVLEDYLAVRPERASELATLLREGRLEAGPWYVLADELIPGAEALVRNLLVGRRQLAALRAHAPPVLYCPDSFGHPAALPELARGFGLPLVVLWRGYGGARWPGGDFVWWRAPSGARALVHHLPRDGYEFGSHLPLGEAEARARWTRLRAELAPRAALGPVLLTHGADHHARQQRWAEAVDALVRAASPDRVHASSLGAFAAAAVDAAAKVPLPEIAGELRDSYGYAWTLQGTFATRAHQKRRNAIAERLLVREAEPFAAIARLAGGAARRPLVDAAWKTLLQCHPHDTLCGCSIDQVARAMDARLDEAIAQGEGIRDDAVLDLIGHDPAAAHRRLAEWHDVLVVRNACARPRGGVARLQWLRKVRDVPVGPGSAPTSPDVLRDDGMLDPLPGMLYDLGGNLLPDLQPDRIESPRHYPDNDLVESIDLLAWVPEVPAYGVTCLPHDARVDARPSWTVSRTHDVAEGGGLRLERHSADRVSLRAPSVDIACVVAIEDVVDRGDTYTPSLRGPGESWQAVEAEADDIFGGTGRLQFESGPLRATIEQRWEASASRSDRRRWEEPASGSWVHAWISLEAGAPFVRIRVRGENHARDHRRRIVIGTGVRDPEVWADAAFGPVRRELIVATDEEAAVELPPPTAPLHRYVSLFDGERGATLYSDGLAEYEVLSDGRIAVTLVRAVGELSRNDLPERPGHAGWPASTPEAQCLGPFACELALLPHGGVRDDATIDLIERTADDVLLPLTGCTLRSAIDVHDASGIALVGDGLACSAIKDAAEGDRVVLRCVNLLERPVDGAWHLPWTPDGAWRARLDETPLQELTIDGPHVPFVAAPREVVTVVVGRAA